MNYDLISIAGIIIVLVCITLMLKVGVYDMIIKPILRKRGVK